MYSYEIDNILVSNNYVIDSDTALKIMRTSPQIYHIKFDSNESCFHMWADEYYWKFDIVEKENYLNEEE